MLYHFFKIISKDISIKDCYVGYCKNMTRMHARMRNNCNCIKIDCNLYNFIRNNGGWKSFTFILIESIELDDKILVNTHLQKLINDNHANLNLL